MAKGRFDAPDAENPEWTEEDMRNAIPFSALPESVKNAILKIKRGPQTGEGWQVRADEALRSWLKRQESPTNR
jgi:hypothetical protein